MSGTSAVGVWGSCAVTKRQPGERRSVSAWRASQRKRDVVVLKGSKQGADAPTLAKNAIKKPPPISGGIRDEYIQRLPILLIVPTSVARSRFLTW